jgi:hypothetical protein
MRGGCITKQIIKSTATLATPSTTTFVNCNNCRYYYPIVICSVNRYESNTYGFCTSLRQPVNCCQPIPQCGGDYFEFK